MTEALTTAFTETGRTSSRLGGGLFRSGGEVPVLLGRERPGRGGCWGITVVGSGGVVVGVRGIGMATEPLRLRSRRWVLGSLGPVVRLWRLLRTGERTGRGLLRCG